MPECEAQNYTPDIAAQPHLTATMLHCVRGGKGIAVLNRMHMPYSDNNMAVHGGLLQSVKN